MLLRVLEAQKWIDQFEIDCRESGRSSASIASLCLGLAAVLESEAGSWLLDVCVDAKRKLGCGHGDLAIALTSKGQALALIAAAPDLG